jgi:3-methyladenine DNA glycosylase Tag
MTRCVFNAGFNWKAIEAKWGGFEAAFEGFDPARLAFLGDEIMDRLIADERIVRKAKDLRHNRKCAVRCRA